MSLTEEQKTMAIETYLAADVSCYAIHVLNQDGSICRTIYIDTKTGETDVELPL